MAHILKAYTLSKKKSLGSPQSPARSDPMRLPKGLPWSTTRSKNVKETFLQRRGPLSIRLFVSFFVFMFLKIFIMFQLVMHRRSAGLLFRWLKLAPTPWWRDVREVTQGSLALSWARDLNTHRGKTISGAMACAYVGKHVHFPFLFAPAQGISLAKFPTGYYGALSPCFKTAHSAILPEVCSIG